MGRLVQRELTYQKIKATARQLMSQQGTAGISIRGIAREMELTPPALYRYFPSQDELITALIVDAFNALADTLAAAVQGGETPLAQVQAFFLAYRGWALAHPVDFQLIYGNPIPGYTAPSEVTVPAAARSYRLLVESLGAALTQGQIIPAPPYDMIPPALSAHLQALATQDGYAVPLHALYLGNLLWSQLHGLVMLDLFQHLDAVVGDVDAFYRLQLHNLLTTFGAKL